MSLNKQNLIHSHHKTLVELTYLALLGRLAEEAAFECAIDEIAEKGYDSYLSSIKSSEEFFEKHFSDPQKTDVFLNEPAPLISSEKISTRKQASNFSKNKNPKIREIPDFLKKTYPTATSDYMQRIRKVTKDF